MRQVVLAFNFLSVVYAIISGLLILSLTTLVAVDFINVDAIPKTAALFALLKFKNSPMTKAESGMPQESGLMLM